ncbi:MAG: deaminase, partial [Bryobacteraceae bacterium]
VPSRSSVPKFPELVLRNSLLWDITEFGRAVHAEMDALLSCGRNGVSTRGALLYATTFPCHNCTRHIIAAGVKRVVYVEPYAKSQAAQLHEDAIRVEATAIGRSSKTVRDAPVPFEPFIGIGPRRFFDLFSMVLSAGYSIERKNKAGRILEWIPRRDSKPRIAMAPSSYLQREVLVSEELDSIFNPRKGTNGKR